jgi:hypothetical protein
MTDELSHGEVDDEIGIKAERAERARWQAENRASTKQEKQRYCRTPCEDERRVDEDLGCATHDTQSACRTTER